MAKRTLDHTSIRIRDLERSRKFYEGLLGLKQATRPDMGLPGAWYELGEGQLHLIQHGGGQASQIDPTAPHFALQVDNFEAVRQQLQEAGLETVELGGEQLWVLDPDGNTVELRPPVQRLK